MPQVSNEQIRRDYAAQPWYSQLGTATTDMIKIAANGLTGNLVNRVSEKIAGAPSGAADEVLRQAKVRAGLAGDVAQVAGTVLGLKGLGGAAGGVKAAVRVAPTAMSVAKAAGPLTAAKLLINRAGPGLVALPEAMSGMAKAKGAAKLAGLAGLLGLSMSGRQEDAAAPAVAPPEPAAEPAAAEAPLRLPTPQERQLAELDMILRSPNHTMSDLKAVTGMLPAPLKPPTIPQAELGKSMELSQALYAAQVKAAQDDLTAGSIDEATARAQVGKALEAHLNRRAMFSGNNPLNLAQAQMFSQDDSGD